MKRTKKFKFSIKLQMLILMLIGLMISGGIFIGLKSIGDYHVWKNYINITEDQVREQNRTYMNDLQKYVNLNRLTVSQAEDTNRWASGEHLKLVFYKDRDLIYYEQETGEEDKNFQSYLSEDDRKKYEDTLKSILDGNADAYPISFMDGTLLVTFVDNTESFLKSFVIAVSLLVSAIFFAVLMLLYFNRITGRISKLAKTVKAVGEGDMERRIYDGGNDEIGSLALDVNSMRNSVVENMSKEREAWEANAGLITAMSHDIRTPLTVMMGYMELMELMNEDPAFAEYIESCKQNAHKLKKLSDDMFSYFLVFGKREFELNMTPTVVGEAVKHMLDEHCILLAGNGYNVSTCWKSENAKILIDQKFFSRVIDNIFSNIGKYANKEKGVNVLAYADEDSFKIITENFISLDTSSAESNGIGNKTCQKIMEQLSGDFKSYPDGELYRNEISLPLYREGSLKPNKK